MKQSTYKRFVIILCSVIVIGGCVLGYQAWGGKQDLNAQTGVDQAPDFTVTDGNGKDLLLSDLAGTPVVVNFFATWCGPCKSELPYFQEAYETYGDQVRFLIVDMITFSDTVSAVEELVSSGGYTFPVYYDTYGEAAAAYQITAIPLTVFVNADGSLANQHLGSMTQSQLYSGIQAILPD